MVERSALPPLRLAALVMAGGALALLLGALWFEHGLGLAPCALCLEQRGPHAAALVLAAFAAAIAGPAVGPARLALGVGALVLAAGAGLAVYHVGVEQHWWPGPASCATGVQNMPATIDALKHALATSRIVRCDMVPWSLFGISLAGYNALFSTMLALGGFAVVASPRWRKPL